MKFGPLAVRAVVGGLFVGHGLQKLTGAFNGPGREGTATMMEALGMRPARANATLAGATETTGGALLIAGAATPLAAASLIGVMITAIRKVHWKNGFWNSAGGFEFNLTLIAALVGLADTGPGDWSVDRLLGIERTGARWALAALATGAAASTLAIEVGRRQPVSTPSATSSATRTGPGGDDPGRDASGGQGLGGESLGGAGLGGDGRSPS